VEAVADVALTTQFDPIFKKYAGKIPVAYLRALGYRESGLRADAANAGGPNAARGLLQVVGVLREDYNRRHGTNYVSNDLLDPDLNVKIAADLLNLIVVAYGKHPSKNLQVDWHNPEFVKLLTAGWNAGFSEAAGVGKVARYLEQRSELVTHDNVFANAAAAGGVVYLQRPDRANWHRSVADLYYLQPDRFDTAMGFGTVLLAGFVVWGVYKLSK
jgi:hypothetical protein